MEPWEYRAKVKKCAWCKYRKHYYVTPHDWDKCIVKNRTISFINAWRPLCKIFKPNMEFKDGSNN